MKRVLLGLVYVFFGLFLIYPLLVLLQGAVLVEVPGPGGMERHFSLQYFELVFENPFYRDCLTNSLLIAVGATLGTFVVAFPIALLFHRVRFPGKAAFEVLFLVPLLLPPFVGAIGLKQLFSRFGAVNLALAHLGLVNWHHPIDWLGGGGFWGIILLEILHLFPILFLGLRAAVASIEPSLREAAQNLGADRWQVFRTIIFPLALPGVYASGSLVFIAAFTDLGVPLMFNFAATLPVQIYNLVTQTDHPVGYALVTLTLLLVGALFLFGRSWGQGHGMLTRGGAREEEVVLNGPPAWGVVALLGGWVTLSILPHLGVVLESMSKQWFLSMLPTQWTLANYDEVCSLPLTLQSMQNSFLYSSVATLVDLALGTTIAWLLSRETFRGKGALDAISMLPLALPGLVTAFAYYVAFSRAPFPASIQSCNQIWLAIFDPRKNPSLLLILAYTLHRLPYIVRSAYAGLEQSSVTLEEASRNLGAGLLPTLARVTIPLLSAYLIAGAIMTFSFAMLDVSNGMILAQESRFYPLTKAIFSLLGRILPSAAYQACALGVLAMAFLAATLGISARFVGRKSGPILPS